MHSELQDINSEFREKVLNVSYKLRIVIGLYNLWIQRNKCLFVFPDGNWLLCKTVLIKSMHIKKESRIITIVLQHGEAARSSQIIDVLVSLWGKMAGWPGRSGAAEFGYGQHHTALLSRRSLQRCGDTESDFC